MTKDEALKKIKELDKKVGFEDDEIFLLSTEEYERYKNIIPHIKQWWWLRSPGSSHYDAASVDSVGSVNYYGDTVNDALVCVRPVLRIALNNLQIGSMFVKYDFPWIKIDDNLAIAEVPIGFEKFDDKSNDYATSYIRKWLKMWLGDRK